MKSKMIVAISGGSSSGKSTISELVKNKVSSKFDTVVLSYDDYYKSQNHVSIEQRAQINFDHPNAFDLDLFLFHMNQLKKGFSIDKPIYDFSIHDRKSVIDKIEAAEVLIVEGLFVLHEEKIRALCDILIYVDTPDDVRFLRRLKRDVKERNRSVESICDQYESTVRPMHFEYIEPSKCHAHIIIPNEYKNSVAIDLICTKIESIKD